MRTSFVIANGFANILEAWGLEPVLCTCCVHGRHTTPWFLIDPTAVFGSQSGSHCQALHSLKLPVAPIRPWENLKQPCASLKQ